MEIRADSVPADVPPTDPLVRPVVLCILDGWGVSERMEGNAVDIGNTPTLDRIMFEGCRTTIAVSGSAVGLPEGQMGNSEIGHLNMGAGRIVYQSLTRINKAIGDGSFQSNQALVEAMELALERGSSLHLMGLVSKGGVHSHIDHLKALLGMAKDHGLERVFVHAFTDGRDVPPVGAAEDLVDLESEMSRLGVGRIATVMGRYYGMDRDNRWERTKLAYDCIVQGEGLRSRSAEEAVADAYQRMETDEFIRPTRVAHERESLVQSGDSVIFFNFRPDRARQLSYAMTDPFFNDFPRVHQPIVHFVCMTQYDERIPAYVAYFPNPLTNCLAEVISDNGLAQLKVAETEKYAHVTYFFNGGREEPFPGETRVLVPSPKVATYDLIPEMSAWGITGVIVRNLESRDYDLIVVNYANLDMVGHTGDLKATVRAVETVDACVKQVWEAVSAAGGVMIVTSDHGNAEEMVYEGGRSPHTAHTINPVPFCVMGSRPIGLRRDGGLSDVAPTVLDLMGIPQPEEMTGRTLIENE
jgi:2,3-bisphosphoglycerate-independent phosphoglycerate mutase